MGIFYIICLLNLCVQLCVTCHHENVLSGGGITRWNCVQNNFYVKLYGYFFYILVFNSCAELCVKLSHSKGSILLYSRGRGIPDQIVFKIVFLYFVNGKLSYVSIFYILVFCRNLDSKHARCYVIPWYTVQRRCTFRHKNYKMYLCYVSYSVCPNLGKLQNAHISFLTDI